MLLGGRLGDLYGHRRATELADLGITAKALHPPVTDTGWVTPEVEQAVADSDQLTHVARPEEVAAVIAYLAGEKS